MQILDLFAGIGGFSLAAHWVGWETAAFVEWEKYPQKVLKKNFPNVPIYGDIKDFHYEQEKSKIGSIDLICGGFPCQPFSTAGKRKGTGDDRYLWPEMLRVIRETAPSWVVGENVAALISMDGGDVFEQVCTSLEDENYSVEAFILPAISVGAPHKRDRIWITAYSEKIISERGRSSRAGRDRPSNKNSITPNANNLLHQGELERRRNIETTEGSKAANKQQKKQTQNGQWFRPEPSASDTDIANPNSSGMEGQPWNGDGRHKPGWQYQATNGHSEPVPWFEPWHEVAARLCRMDDGVSGRLDRHRTNRLKALGNAIVPQVAYNIFQSIKMITKN